MTTVAKSIKTRLIAMNILQWAVWGAYLTSMGSFLALSGFAGKIGIAYAMQGIVSIFMPALMGIIADKFLAAERTLGMCHAISGAAMLSAGLYAMSAGAGLNFAVWFTLYSTAVAFYMPTIAVSNSVAYKILEDNGYDSVKAFPPIRVFGTVGFIVAMLAVNFIKNSDGVQFQLTYNQFILSGSLSLALFLYCFTLPSCKETSAGVAEDKTFAQRIGLDAFKLFKSKDMAIFFIFSMLLGVSLQITNGFANPYITSFKEIPEYANTWGALNANALISISQLSETLCILLIPFALKKFGIKRVMLIAMFAWVFRFGLFGAGNPGNGVWMFILSCIIYGVAFDFFNISGSLYVNQKTDASIRNSAQGLFILMTNGIGATVGTLSAQAVVNRFVYNAASPSWSTAWYIFAAYALVVAIAFVFAFKDPDRR